MVLHGLWSHNKVTKSQRPRSFFTDAIAHLNVDLHGQILCSTQNRVIFRPCAPTDNKKNENWLWPVPASRFSSAQVWQQNRWPKFTLVVNAVKDQCAPHHVGRGSLGRRSFGLCATKSRSGVQARKKVALNRVQTNFYCFACLIVTIFSKCTLSFNSFRWNVDLRECWRVNMTRQHSRRSTGNVDESKFWHHFQIYAFETLIISVFPLDGGGGGTNDAQIRIRKDAT